ncbi:outer membrane lipoprotein carrier protein LolA [Aureibaculum marinum]|uniref:Outer membrane lipoprotein carrier protein LolA n=1 Tax=Aureibaculum marinum TaxID=2487930 RepID=A0A3N4P1K1_9FLAO|nr:outer membrane lipoprotein carrier protein LolA [Aureibaculum marinum]RPD98866.1 outer membrane lipoprotein carrier protein LolA [Aureibaculum marinum]
MTPKEITDLKKNVKIVAQKTTTINSDFDQFKHMEFLSDAIKTSGKMKFKAPKLVKWSYTKPFQYSVVFKEGNLLINNEGKKSDVNIGSNQLFQQLNQLIVKSISGDMFDETEFTMNFIKTTENYIVTFNSKDAELKKYIKQFILYFDKENYTVMEVKMVEPSDDYTHIIFKNRIENQTIKDEVFKN